MKKILLLLVGLLSLAPTFAQSDGEEDFIPTKKEKNNAFFIGLKAGGVMTSMSDPDEGKLADGSGFGMSGGLAFQARFGKATENSVGGTGYFGIGLEVKYKQNKAKTIGVDEEGVTNTDLSIDYLEVPVYVQLYPLAKTASMNSLYIELGASYANALSVKPKTLTLNEPNADFSSITYKLDADGSKLKGSDLRPMVGIGYSIPNTGLGIGARYYMGTSKLADNFNCKMNSFEFSIAYLFKAGKF